MRSHIGVIFAEGVEGEWTIDRVALVMNIVPCRNFSLGGQAREKQTLALST